MPRPEAYVSTRKSRLPIYNGKTVYLNDGQEFELELFNPTNRTVGIYIKINGAQTSSSMLVIRPGMRYFLDRYVDEARKFAFNTYQAENSAAGKAATASNGLIEISFHNEMEKLPAFTTFTQPTFTQPYGTTNPYYFGALVNIHDTNVGTLNEMNCCYFSDSSNSPGVTSLSTFETGRVEKGGASEQSFSSYHGDFDSSPSHTVSWEIKPASQRAEKLRVYCQCGKRMKNTWAHCPACGHKK